MKDTTFYTKGETVEAKTKLQLCLVSMPNMETMTPLANQTNINNSQLDFKANFHIDLIDTLKK